MITPASHHSTPLVLQRTFEASRARVFRAWITPKALEQWLRPRGMRMTVRSLDARVGGSFRFELENGSSIIGTYLEIVPLEKLVFTWSAGAAPGQETVVTLDLLEHGAATELILTHEHLATPKRHVVAEGGWSSVLNTLASALSSPHLDW